MFRLSRVVDHGHGARQGRQVQTVAEAGIGHGAGQGRQVQTAEAGIIFWCGSVYKDQTCILKLYKVLLKSN
jgi:hypothetical protein